MNADRAPSHPVGPAEHVIPGGTAPIATYAAIPATHPSGEVGTDLLDPVPTGEPRVGGTVAPEQWIRIEGVAGSWTASPSPNSATSSLRPAEARPRPVAVRRWARWRLPGVYAAVAVLLGTGLAVAFGTHDQLRRTDDRLRAEQTLLHRTLVRSHRAEAELGTVSGQATDAARTLAAETSQLATAEARLASTEANVFTNGVSINNLDACMSGVEQALNLISLADQPGAARALDGVAASCRAAEPEG